MKRAQVVTALTAVAVTAAAVLVVGQGYHTSQVRMHSGAIWLASAQTGQATLVDGASAEVKANVPVAEPGAALSVTQQGSAAHVLNHETGELRRIDSATEQASPPVTTLPAADLRSAPGVLFAIDVHSGTLASVDPDTLKSKGEPEQLAEAVRPDSVVVDSRGRLWAIDDVTGDLVWMVEGERRTRSAATKNGRLAITKDQPVLVDPERGTAELLYPETGAVARSVRLDLPADAAVVVSGSADRSRLLIATGGELVVCSFDAGSCGEPVQISSSGAKLGAAVEVNNHAVVPDYSTGQATVVDLTNSHVVAQLQLFEEPTRFELLARDGIVFFNDPNSNKAGVLDLSGEVRTITKYTEQPTEGDTPSTPDQRAQPDQVKKVDYKKPGLGIPGHTVQPSRRNPAPSPAASIVVKPGNHGVVGDEFELTIVLQSTGAATTRWWFGDGTEATGATVRHRWQQPGAFTVRATATSDTGTQVQAESTVTVDPVAAPPRITQLNVQRPKPVIGQSVRFSADSTGKPDRWAWTVTRPGALAPEVTAETPEFEHRFAIPGTYTVALTISMGTQTAQSSRQFTVVRGAVKGWGDNFFRQLDIPPSAASGVVAIDAGGAHGLALRADGAVITWGQGEHGQLAVPPEARSGVVAIAAGDSHSLALRADGAVIAWGDNTQWQTDVPQAAKRDVVAIAAGAWHSLALKRDGSVIAWGQNNEGQASVPPEALSGVTAIAAGLRHSMVLKADGSVVDWGYGCNGRVTGALAIAAGQDFCLALQPGGSVFGWGDGEWGQLAIPPSAKSDVIAMDAKYMHSLALKEDGSVVGWGDDGTGEPIPPEYTRGVQAIAVGGQFSLVLMDT